MRGGHGAGFRDALGAVGAVCRVAGLRFGGAGGLAGQPSAEALSGLEEAAAAGSVVGHAKEAGPGLSQWRDKNRSCEKHLDEVLLHFELYELTLKCSYKHAPVLKENLDGITFNQSFR